MPIYAYICLSLSLSLSLSLYIYIVLSAGGVAFLGDTWFRVGAA